MFNDEVRDPFLGVLQELYMDVITIVKGYDIWNFITIAVTNILFIMCEV